MYIKILLKGIIMLRLYYASGSCAQAAHILLEDAEANYTSEKIDLKTGEQRSPEYLKINPKGRVPTLVTENGILTETPSILAYICQIYPEKNLAPSDPFGFAEAQAFNMYIATTVHIGHAHKHRGTRWTDDKQALASLTARVNENMTAYAKAIEKYYFKGPFVLGKKYSMCDPYLATITRWFKDDGVNLDNFPLIKNHNELMNSRKSMIKVSALHGLK